MKCFRISLTILLISSILQTYSGNITLYRKTDNNIPKESIQTWDLNSDKRIYVYYEHDYIYTSNVNYRISISKKVNNFFVRQESKDFPVQKGQKKSITFFDIKETGVYIVSIIDDNGYIIGEQNYTVQ